jgi:hypothetical protein
MTTIKYAWRWGIGAGAVAAILDVSLILAVDPSISRWVLLEAALFWMTAGWAVVASDSGLGRFGHGVLATVLLNLPWYVVESFASGHPEHLPPLVAMSILFGLGFGWAKGRALQALSQAAVLPG